MLDLKGPFAMHSRAERDALSDYMPSDKKGTGSDQHDMERTGKTQETKVGLDNFVSSFG